MNKDKKQPLNVHGRVVVIYRVIGREQEDIDLTREQAIRTLQQLRNALYPRDRRKQR